MTNGSVVVGTVQNWKKEVEESSIPVLVDFWASWCGPCRFVSPIIDKIAEKHNGKVRVVKVDVDENQELAMKFQIMSIPTVLLFNKGKVLASRIGAAPADVFEAMLTRNVQL